MTRNTGTLKELREAPADGQQGTGLQAYNLKYLDSANLEFGADSSPKLLEENSSLPTPEFSFLRL